MNARAKPFTTIAGILFLAAAAVHLFRLYARFDVVVGSHSLPVIASLAFVPFALLMGVMLLRESRR